MLEEKAKISCLREGDRNSSFFHASIKARRAYNAISLKLDDGTCTNDGDIIAQQSAEYFKKLFGNFSHTETLFREDIIQHTISEDNDALVSCPDLEEIKDNVFSMSTSSSPGPDGFSGKHYTSCWDIIKGDLHQAIHAFFEGLQLPKIISSTSIVLIPKVHKASSLDQVRPISLCQLYTQNYFKDSKFQIDSFA
ncbi:hypothetical protein QQ045_013112 [Rhodiola kirilowii]